MVCCVEQEREEEDEASVPEGKLFLRSDLKVKTKPKKKTTSSLV